MRILITADPALPVPPRFYGGIERVIALLADGLVARGHDVTLVAHGDSAVSADLVPYRDDRMDAAGSVRAAATVTAAVLKRRPQLVQSFGRLASLAPILAWPVRKVMSYQREVTPHTVRWANRLAHGTLAFTGCSQQLIAPVADIGTWSVVYNAVPLDRLTFRPAVAADAPLVFLGRVEPIKGPHLAIEIARRAGRRLVIAGNVPNEAREFFKTQIEPHVNGRDVVYAGPVDDVAKDALLGSAAAFLMPILWDEPFGIVMAEALACGTPVLGLRRGSVPEVITDGVTGVVAADVDGLVEAVGGIPRLSRHACRAAAESRFSPAALVDAYESIYAAATDGSQPVPARRTA